MLIKKHQCQLNTYTLYLQFVVFFICLPFSPGSLHFYIYFRCMWLFFRVCPYQSAEKTESRKNTSKYHLYFIALYQIFSLQMHLFFFHFFFWQTLKNCRLQTQGTYDLIEVSTFLKEEAQRVKRRAIYLIILYLFVWILQMVFIFLIDVML